jgi:membrane-bound ClpP family serine protease
MIVLGIVLIIVGLLLPQFGILETIGIILLLIGLVLWFLPAVGRPVGRGVYRGRYW